MIGHIVHKADFEKALASPSRIRSAHFALHHVNRVDRAAPTGSPELAETGLSTGSVDAVHGSVDDLAGEQLLLGCVIPKRHARRAVTRNLLRRQIRAVAERFASRLRPGLWVVRLRLPFAREKFPSAASDALALAVRTELDQLFGRAAASRTADRG